MFRKFVKEENITGQTQLKSSAARAVRAKLLEQYPKLSSIIDDIIPKKQPLVSVKCTNHIMLLVVNNEVLFFNERDGPFHPTLRLLHRYPDFLPRLQVDRGAIKFVMQGANIMCPGLTSPGGSIPEDLPEGTICAIFAEGKQYALAVGVTKMSTQQIKQENKDVGVINLHYLNDGLWKIDKL